MKVSVKLYTSDGQTTRGYPVKLIVTHKGQTRRKTIGYSSFASWDEVGQVPNETHVNYLELYGQILDYRKLCLQVWPEDYTVDDMMQQLNCTNKVQLTLQREYFSALIDQLKQKGRYGNADAYKYTLNQLEAFSPGLALQQITPQVVQAFKQYKIRWVSDKTIKNYLGVWRAVYNQALQDPKINLVDKQPFVGVMRGLVVRQRRRKNRYLLKDQLQALEDQVRVNTAGLTRAELRAVKISLLQFYLCGVDLVDLYHLHKKNFYSDRVVLTRQKLGRYKEEFNVKVFPQARRLLDQLSSPTDNFVLGVAGDHTRYKTYRRNHLRSLAGVQQKMALQVQPIDQRLNTKVFRHSFATLGKFEGIDPDLLRELMGHERNTTDTVYKDVWPENVRDSAHERIIALK